MIATRERRLAAAALAIVLTTASVRPAFSGNTLSFPPTTFTILNPTTGIAMGRSRYRLDSVPDGATLHGENSFYDDQSDVETAHIRLGTAGQLPRLIEFDHTFFNADGTILKRAHFDLRTGAATCIDNSNGQKSTQSAVLTAPDDTWAGASVVIPIQESLREGVRQASPPLHVFNCAPKPEIFAVSVRPDPGNAVWTAYGAQALRVELRPDFGWLNLIVAPFVPKLHAWFDPNDGYSFVGDEAARYYKGPPIMLVKAREATDRERRAKSRN